MTHSAQPGRRLKIMMLDPAGSTAGVAHNLCVQLSKSGCDVHVFTAPHWLRVIGNSQIDYQTHICFYRDTQMRSYDSRGTIRGVFWRMIRLIQHVCTMVSICALSRDFDIVHTQILPLPVFDYFYLRWIAHRTPLVCSVHELVPHKSRYRRFTAAWVTALHRIASVLFVYTEYTRVRLVQRGLPERKIVRVSHGSLDHLRDMKPSATVDDGPPSILFLGSIRPDKGLDVLIRAASLLREKVPQFKVQVAGVPGFDVTELRKLAMDLGLQETIEFHLGYLSEEEFAARLRSATIVVLPYRRIEQSGIAFAACTFGKAIVATRCGGLEELVTEAGNGLLFPIDDHQSLADALSVLLLDPAKRRECESHSLSYARDALSWKTIVSKTLAGYCMAMASAGRSSPQIAIE